MILNSSKEHTSVLSSSSPRRPSEEYTLPFHFHSNYHPDRASSPDFDRPSRSIDKAKQIIGHGIGIPLALVRFYMPLFAVNIIPHPRPSLFPLRN